MPGEPALPPGPGLHTQCPAICHRHSDTCIQHKLVYECLSKRTNKKLINLIKVFAFGPLLQREHSTRNNLQCPLKQKLFSKTTLSRNSFIFVNHCQLPVTREDCFLEFCDLDHDLLTVPTLTSPHKVMTYGDLFNFAKVNTGDSELINLKKMLML